MLSWRDRYLKKLKETKISDFHTSFYIPAIQKLAFHIPHVRILGANHCGEIRRTAFKRRELFQDVLCRRDYAERVVASFANQIKLEYYGGNIYVSIEVIELEHFSAVTQADINSSTMKIYRITVMPPIWWTERRDFHFETVSVVFPLYDRSC